MQIEELGDREEIRELLHHYCWCIDSRQPDLLLTEFYTRDAVDDHGAVRLEGPAQIGDFMRQLMVWSEGHAHVLSNVHIELAGDRARARSYVTAWHWLAANAGAGSERPADYVSVGMYLDELRREAEGWRVADRRFDTSAPGYTAIGAFPQVEFVS
jgi:hypothetical protein